MRLYIKDTGLWSPMYCKILLEVYAQKIYLKKDLFQNSVIHIL